MSAAALRVSALFALLVLVVPARGDDVGLASARLTELEGDAYVIEVEVPPQLLGAIAPPVLPARFTHEKTLYRPRGALISVRYGFGGGGALRGGDVVLLPWGRTGVLLDTRWRDGTRRSALFLARVDGIPIPVHMLRPDEPTAGAAARSAAVRGALHVLTQPAYWTLLVALALLVPARSLRLVIGLVTGHALSLVACDLGAPEVPTALARGVLLVAAIVAARDAILRRAPAAGTTRFLPVLVIAGALDGLAHGRADVSADLAAVTSATFAIGAAAAAVGVSAGLAAVRTLVREDARGRIRTVLCGAVGAAAVAALVDVVAARTAPAAPRTLDAARFALQRGPAPAAPGRQAAPRELTHPVMMFLTVEAFELRCEVLASAAAMVDHVGVRLRDGGVIGIDEQGAVLDDVLRSLTAEVALAVDGRTAAPDVASVDFLTLSAAGAATRDAPVPEALASAILGATLVYVMPAVPERLELRWDGRPAGVGPVPITLTDPDGVDGAVMSAAEPRVVWENDLLGFVPPRVLPVAVERTSWPAGSAVLLALGLVAAALVGRIPARRSTVLMAACTAGAIALAPYLRAPSLPGAGVPPDRAAATLERLLANVYRSFGFREEGAIYDALAVSVTGDHLADVYFQHRRTLERQSTGGARARVDAVDVSHVESVSTGTDGALEVVASWTVTGSVSHFGHMHYRRNRRTARVRLVTSEGVWKIDGIEVLAEIREL